MRIKCGNLNINETVYIQADDVFGMIDDPLVEVKIGVNFNVKEYNCLDCGFQLFDKRTAELLNTIYRMGGQIPVIAYFVLKVENGS